MLHITAFGKDPKFFFNATVLEIDSCWTQNCLGINLIHHRLNEELAYQKLLYLMCIYSTYVHPQQDVIYPVWAVGPNLFKASLYNTLHGALSFS